MPHGGQGPEWHLMVLVSLVLFAVVINALDPSYQAFYTTFSHLVTLQSVSIALLWTWKHHDNQAWLGTACQALSFVIFALSVQTTVQTGRDVGHCLENTATDREDAHNCIDLYASYAALDGPHGVQNACATLGKPVASILGGVCLNIEYKGTTGEALLVLQVVWATLALIVNGHLAFSSRKESHDDNLVQVTTSNNKQENPPSYKAAKIGTNSAGNKKNRPLRSIYYKDISN